MLRQAEDKLSFGNNIIILKLARYGRMAWMAYREDIFECGEVIEHEFKYMGRYGAKGEKRGQRRKATSDQIKKQNLANKIKRVRRVILLNFHPWDLWLTLKYKRGTRKDTKEVLADVKDWTDKLRNVYKKEGESLKWIRRIEIGAQGGIHIHILVNRPRSMPTIDLTIKKLWGRAGINFQSLREEGGYGQLASYICKQTDDEMEGQLSFLPDEDRKRCISYSTSRNLIRPEDVRIRKKYGHWTMRRILKDGPKPREGYYIDKDSIRTGINPYTGMSYFYYSEIKIKNRWDGDLDKGKEKLVT